MCNEESITYTDHPNIEASNHLNRSKLHLNRCEEGDVEVNRAAISCGDAALLSSGFGACAGTKDEIEDGNAEGYCGSVPPSPSPSMHSFSNDSPNNSDNAMDESADDKSVSNQDRGGAEGYSREKSFQNTVVQETGLSDFHAMVVTVLKGGYVKKGPKIITYRDYSRFSAEHFRIQLFKKLSQELVESGDNGAFEAVVMGVLNQHAPVKKKSICANNGPFVTKALRKDHMHRTRLRNKYSKNRTTENFKAFKKQRNKCVKLLRQAKFDYYRSIDLDSLTDNYKFWKTVKPLFSDKVQIKSAITLMEDGKWSEKTPKSQIFGTTSSQISRKV
eukprot:gene4297-biopygen3488